MPAKEETQGFVILKGHYRDDSGLLNSGALLLEKVGENFFCPETGSVAEATWYSAAKEMRCIEITSSGVWEFIPDSGECERVGMKVR